MNKKRMGKVVSFLVVLILLFNIIPSYSPAFASGETNLALNKTVVSSSNEVPELFADKAVDGDTGTRWSSAYNDDEWIYVDLGSVNAINRVVLNWESYASGYDIQVSDDAQNWTTIYSTTTGNGGIDDIKGLSGSGRYVRMKGILRATQWGYSLYELEVYETVNSVVGALANINATSTYTTITLTWDAVEYATGYDIEVDGVVIDNGSSTTYKHSGLICDTQHAYRVRAKNGIGAGEWSEVLATRTFAAIQKKIKIDGNADDWVGISVLAGNEEAGIWTVQDGSKLYVMAKGNAVGDYIDFWLDTDMNAGTGFGHWAWEGDGTDYLIENGNLYVYNPSTNWVSYVKGINYKKIGNVYEAEVDKASIGMAGKGELRVAYSGNELKFPEVGAVPVKTDTQITGILAAGVPANINATSTYTTITLTWDAVEDAAGYDIEADGVVIDNGSSTTYKHSGLICDTQHAYRVRAKNGIGAGEWSEVLAPRTFAAIQKKIKIDGNADDWVGISALAGNEEAGIWTVQDGSKLYVMAKGNAVGDYIDFWLDTDMNAGTGFGHWAWEEDGTDYLIENGNLYVYNSSTNWVSYVKGINYKKNGNVYEAEVDKASIGMAGKGELRVAYSGNELKFPEVGAVPVKTDTQITGITPAPTNVPSNITAIASNTTVTLTWDAVDSAEGYDIETDGVIIDNGVSSSYVQHGLLPDTQHTYRVRAKTEGGAGGWSDATTKTTLAPISAVITVDGNTSDWEGIAPIASGSGTTTGLYAVQDNDKLYLLIKGTDIGQWNDFYIDSDNNSATGRNHWPWPNSGEEYLIEDGRLFLWSSAASDWIYLREIEISRNSTVVEIAVELNQIGRTSRGEMKVSYSRGNFDFAPVQGNRMAMADMLIDGVAPPPPADEIVFNGSVYNEVAEYYQYCLKSLGYTDGDGALLDIDGYFGNHSKSALNKFLIEHQYEYFGEQASEALVQAAEALADLPYDSGFASGTNKPDPFAFVYGNISNVHNTHDPFYSMKVLKSLPYIITHEPGLMSYTQKRVASHIKANTKIFAYVNLGPNNPEQSRENWIMSDLPAVKAQIDRIAGEGWYGVFIDQFGYDFGETRARQNEIVDYAHSKGLKCFVNAWFPEDAMSSNSNPAGNPDGLVSHLGSGDWYLIESYFVGTQGFRGTAEYIDKYLRAKQYQDTMGVNIVGLSYRRDDVTWDNSVDDVKMSFVLAQCLGLKGWWFCSGLGNDAFIYGTDPGMDIGNTFKQQLHHVSGNKYIAQTEKYTIEYYAGDKPYMVLEPVSQNEQMIVIGQLPAPSNINSTAASTTIIVTWDAVKSAIGYDIEIDGSDIVDNGNNTAYTHSGLQQNTQHTYRVRAKNANGTGDWSTATTKTTLIAAPSSVTGVSTSNIIALTWDAIAGATGYDVEVDGSNIVDNGTNTTYVNGGLQPNTMHTYRVRAKNANGASEWSSAITKTTLVAVPANITGVPSSNSIALAWDTVTGATGYDIEVDGNSNIVNNGMNTTYINTGLQPNTQHTYRVRAKNANGLGAWSTAITKTTLIAAPTSITGVPTVNSIALIWNTIAGATGYDVEVDGSNIIDNGTNTTYVNSGLQQNTQHTYRVRAKNANGPGAWSTLVTQTTLVAAPSGLAGVSTSNSVVLTWNAVAGATGYEIEVDSINIIDSGTNTSYTNSGLIANTTHSYRVRAKNVNGVGAWSTSISKTTTLSMPINVKVISSLTAMSISWDAVPGATGYDIEINGTVINNGTSITYIDRAISASRAFYFYRIRAKNANGPSDWTASYVGSLFTLEVDKYGPQLPGTTIRFTMIDGIHPGTLLYKFVVNDGTRDVEVQNYSSNNVFNWIPYQGGTYNISVYIRNPETPIGDFIANGGYSGYVINPINVSLTADKVRDDITPVGQPIHLTTNASGGTQLLYQYGCNLNGVATILQDYSYSNTFTWYPANSGSQVVYVHVKDINSAAGFFIEKCLVYDIIPGTPQSTSINVNLTADKTRDSITPVGQPIHLTANASGGTHLLYQYGCNLNGVATILQDYTESNTYTWYPANAGSQVVYVHVKDISSPADYFTEKCLVYDITPMETGNYGFLPSNSLTWPVPNSNEITSRFGIIDDLYPVSHDGLDIQGELGENIAAAYDGQVVYKGNDAEYGNYININSVVNGVNIQTRYAHLSDMSMVSVGNNVFVGAIIGKMGSTGNSTGPHLHFEVLLSNSNVPCSNDGLNSTKVDPLLYLKQCDVDYGIGYLSNEFNLGISVPSSANSTVANENYRKNKGLALEQGYLRRLVQDLVWKKEHRLVPEGNSEYLRTDSTGYATVTINGRIGMYKPGENGVLLKNGRMVINATGFEDYFYGLHGSSTLWSSISEERKKYLTIIAAENAIDILNRAEERGRNNLLYWTEWVQATESLHQAQDYAAYNKVYFDMISQIPDIVELSLLFEEKAVAKIALFAAKKVAEETGDSGVRAVLGAYDLSDNPATWSIGRIFDVVGNWVKKDDALRIAELYTRCLIVDKSPYHYLGKRTIDANNFAEELEEMRDLFNQTNLTWKENGQNVIDIEESYIKDFVTSSLNNIIKMNKSNFVASHKALMVKYNEIHEIIY